MRADIENPMVMDRLWKQNNTKDEVIPGYKEEYEEIECDVCQTTFLLEDVGKEVLESEKWEDTYVCDKTKCLTEHYIGWSATIPNKNNLYSKTPS